MRRCFKRQDNGQMPSQDIMHLLLDVYSIVRLL